MKSDFTNIAAYKFVPLSRLPERKKELLSLSRSLDLRGTILLADEGINLFLAGRQQSINAFVEHMHSQVEFADLPVKESISDHQPFNRMLVRIKREIISMGVEAIRPGNYASPKISALTLKAWLDAGKDVTLLDVRNDYEVKVGTFSNAVPIGVDHFREFPNASKQLPEEIRKKPVVMFCTGGIRCEKAGPLMEQEGFQEIYQLDGGILKYFADCGGEHYEGDCFVFDRRVAVDPGLQETDLQQCYNCRAAVDRDQRASDLYDPPNSCPACYESPGKRMEALLRERTSELARVTTPLPGSMPYDNARPLNVPLRFDKARALEFLCGIHATLDESFWRAECEAGRVVYQTAPVGPDVVVRSGWRLEHHLPQTVEPQVNSQVGFVYEDNELLVIEKPAPLPMHASGRFNRNTLIYFLKSAMPRVPLRIVHRLDANTTGLVVLAKTKSSAASLHQQFLGAQVKKTYLACVAGAPPQEHFVCTAPISREPSTAGSRQVVGDGGAGLDATTEFSVLKILEGATALIECRPLSGRTNQIRLHLAHCGFPVVGDPTYNAGDNGIRQSLSVDDAPMCLHAWRLEFQHPSSETNVVFEAVPPSWSALPS